MPKIDASDGDANNAAATAANAVTARTSTVRPTHLFLESESISLGLSQTTSDSSSRHAGRHSKVHPFNTPLSGTKTRWKTEDPVGSKPKLCQPPPQLLRGRRPVYNGRLPCSRHAKCPFMSMRKTPEPRTGTSRSGVPKARHTARNRSRPQGGAADISPARRFDVKGTSHGVETLAGRDGHRRLVRGQSCRQSRGLFASAAQTGGRSFRTAAARVRRCRSET